MMPPELLDALAQHRPLGVGEWRLVRRIEARHTELFELRGNGSAGSIFLKRSRKRRPGGIDRRLRRERRALLLLQGRGGSSDPPMPRLLVALPQHHALVISGVPGSPLAGILKREANRLTGWLKRGALAAHGAAAGRWLRSFHERTAAGTVCHDHDRFRRELELPLGRIHWDALEAERDALVGRLLAGSERLHGFPLDVAAHHGDFLPQNILLHDGAAAVVDFESFRRRDIVHRDIGALLAYLELIAERPVYLPAALQTFAASFRVAYGAAATGEVQSLYTAEAVVRVGADSRHDRIARRIVRVLRRLPLRDAAAAAAGAPA